MLTIKLLYRRVTLLVGFVVVLCFASQAFSQSIDRIELGRAKDMLKNVKNEIKNGYYDTSFHGMDLDARFKTAEEKMDKAGSIDQAFAIIAQAVLDLDDSHTTFFPPSRSVSVEYGWRMRMIGDKCFVIAVKPKSDAEKMGLKPGDQVLSLESFKPGRNILWKMNYFYNALSPRTALRLRVLSPGEQSPRDLAIPSKVKKSGAFVSLEQLIWSLDHDQGDGEEHRFMNVGETVIWKMPSFVLDPGDIDSIMDSRIKSKQNLILDLRGNGGGYVKSLEELAGYFVTADTKIADLKGRKEMKPMMAQVQKKGFPGKVIVLIDSDSGSAAEIFARFIQLENRGTVLGDVSAGAVMQSRVIPMKMGVNTIVPFGMSLTEADVIMKDGKSIEHVGVTPQTEIIPTGEDLAQQRDPVISAALKLLGQDVPPDQAGKMFPYKWEDN